LAAFQDKKPEFDALQATIIGASVDTLEETQQVAAKGLEFPMAYGVKVEDAEGLGAWRAEDHHGTYIQPTEFLLGRGGVVLGALYASGPVGRMGADEALTFITNREARARQQEQQQPA
jgi:peroxiredoxin